MLEELRSRRVLVLKLRTPRTKATAEETQRGEGRTSAQVEPIREQQREEARISRTGRAICRTAAMTRKSSANDERVRIASVTNSAAVTKTRTAFAIARAPP